MKKTIILFSCLLSLTLATRNAFASGSWLQKASSPLSARQDVTCFTIGHYAFVGCGYDGTYRNDFQKWNQTTNTWSSIASYPGNGKDGCSGFTIEGKGYVGFGNNGASRNNDLWRYDTAANAWTQMTNFPGSARYSQSAFVLGHKAWIIAGSTGGPPYLQDVWVYDAHQNTWTQKNNFPGGQVEGVITFTIGKFAYVGGGWNSSNSQSTFWKYDSANDTWASIASIPSPTGVCTQTGFTLSDYGFVCTGGITGQFIKYGYQYDTASNTWLTFTNMGADGLERGYNVGFSLGGYGYICMGADSNGSKKNDLWQWTPPFFGFASVQNDATRFNLYPNPNNGKFTFTYSGLEAVKSELKITNILGQDMNTYTVNGREGNLSIDETKLPNGIYFYRLTDNNKVVSTGKFVVAK